MNTQRWRQGALPRPLVFRALALVGFLLPATAFANLGGFEVADGYVTQGDVTPAAGFPTLVNGYNAGAFSTAAGFVSTLPNRDLGLWNDLNDAYGFYAFLSTANINTAYGYYVTKHPTIGSIGMLSHSGGNMLAVRNVGPYPGGGRPLDFRYSLDSRDLANVNPLATAASEVKWSVWVSPGPIPNPALVVDGFYWTFRDSNGAIGLQLGYDNTFQLRYRLAPSDPWVTLPEVIGRPWHGIYYFPLQNCIYDRIDVTFDLLNDKWSLSVFDTQSATLTPYVVDLPFGHRLDNLTTLDWHLSYGMDKTFFDDSSFVVSDAVADAPGYTYTIGYWKTHPEAWPVDTLFVGGVSYSLNQALGILNTEPKKGDATNILLRQLIAAKLSVLVFADDTALGTTIADADAFLVAHPPGSTLSKAEREQAIALAAFLDAFNNGLLPGAPHAP